MQSIAFFPKKNLESCSLSIVHAMPMHPQRVKTTAVAKNSMPVGSKEKTERKLLDKMVKMGENSRMTSVFRPMKWERCLMLSGR